MQSFFNFIESILCACFSTPLKKTYFYQQLTPFPFDLVRAELLKYPKANICWVQEEHKNMGPYPYVEPRIRTVLKKIEDSREIE